MVLYGLSGFPGGASVKNLSANAADIRDVDLNLGSERAPGAGHGKLLQYSCLENPKDRGAWRAKSYSSWGRKEWDRTEGR